MISQEELKRLLRYDPDTGLFTWLVAKAIRVKVGDVAGCLNHKGYAELSISGRKYQAHRLAWLYMQGVFPPMHIDHINGIRSDNSIGNLRVAINQENGRNRGKQANNKSGHKGMCGYKAYDKGVARCTVNGKKHFLGYFTNVIEASEAYEAFAKEHFGTFYKEPTPL